MRPLLIFAAVAGAATLALSGCGGSSSDNSSPAASGPSNTSSAGNTDVSTLSGSSAAAGTAIDVGFNQLYQGASNYAWIPRRHTDLSTDAVPSDVLTMTSAGGPGTPTVQSPTTLQNTLVSTDSDQLASGTATFTSDQNDASGNADLPPNWWHARVSITAGQSLTVSNDDGGVATISSGQMDLWIFDQTGTPTSPGNWTRIADVFAIIPASNPVSMTVTPYGGAARTVNLTGFRHVHHNITHAVDTSGNVTRTDVTTINGNTYGDHGGGSIDDFVQKVTGASALLGTTLLPAGATNGPVIDGSHYFTQWIHKVTLADSTTKTWQWDRWATFTVTQTKAATDTTWTGASVSGENQIIFITVNGITIGPFSRADLKSSYNVGMDLTKLGRNL